MSGTEMPAVPLELFESFMKYEWPGNIEELQSAVKNLTIAPSGSLSIESLPFELYLRPMEILDEKELPDAVCEVEIFMIRQALRKSRGNVRSAARSLRIAEPVLRRKIKKYELGWIRD